MIAVKREVAADSKEFAGFPWSECQGPERDEEPDDKSLYQTMSALGRNTGVKRTES